MLPGKAGLATMQQVMQSLRDNPPAEFGGFAVTALRDYQKSVRTENGRTEAITLHKSNVLYFELEDRAWICVRPSGTEPKIKVYLSAVANSEEAADAINTARSDAAKDWMK